MISTDINGSKNSFVHFIRTMSYMLHYGKRETTANLEIHTYYSHALRWFKMLVNMNKSLPNPKIILLKFKFVMSSDNVWSFSKNNELRKML